MKRPTRPHRDSAEQIALALLDRQRGPLPVPRHIALPRAARPFWNDITSARLRHEWAAAELPLVAAAARMMAEIVRIEEDTALTPRERIRLGVPLQKTYLKTLRALKVLGARRIPPPLVPVLPQDGSGLLAE